MNKETLMFRMVPTMRCNYRCEYCFEPDNPKKYDTTMFDNHSVKEWVEGLKKFDDYNIELYLWGGEPFCIEQTYEFIRESVKMDHIISGFRIDTNTFYAEKIAERCPSSKVKLNCSYHMQYHSLEEQLKKIKILKELDMVGMVNFVASKYNLNELKRKYGMSVADLIKEFDKIGVFLNVAGDFKYANNPKYERYEEYKKFIMQFISEEEWDLLRSVKGQTECTAGQKMFTINKDGRFSSCISEKDYGNFFDGILNRDEKVTMCNKRCPSLVAYPFRCDNQLPSVNHLIAYVERNRKYREALNGEYFEFEFKEED